MALAIEIALGEIECQILNRGHLAPFFGVADKDRIERSARGYVQSWLEDQRVAGRGKFDRQRHWQNPATRQLRSQAPFTRHQLIQGSICGGPFKRGRPIRLMVQQELVEELRGRTEDQGFYSLLCR